MVKRKSGSAPSSKFTEELLEAFARDLKSQRVPLERQQVSDDRVVGLRAMVHKTGLITYNVSYYLLGSTDKKRPFMKIGEGNKDSPNFISIEDARNIAIAIKALGEKGIDVQRVSYLRLIRELRDQGANWKIHKDDRK